MLCCEEAIEIDPNYAPAMAHLAVPLANGVRLDGPGDPAVAEMIQLAQAALALDGNDPEVLPYAGAITALPGGDLAAALR